MVNQYLVDSPYSPFTIKNQFKAISNGKVYIGEVDKDPLNPSQQIQIYVVDETGSNMPVSQPIQLNAGGYLVYNGQVSKFITLEPYSMVVLNNVDAEMWRVDDISKVDPDNITASNVKDTTGGGSVQDFIDETNPKVDESLIFTSHIGRFGTTEDIPPTQEYTLDGMGESVENPLTTPPVNYKSPVSVRGERITATGTTAGGSAGSVNYYTALELSRAGDSITDCWYFGNGKGTFLPYQSGTVNEWINPFIFGANYQKMIGNTILEPCGHAIENAATATRGLIAANNFAYKHNGLGVTNVIGYVSNGNLSDTTSDSHITENSCTHAALVGNVGHSAIAASGQDLAGGMNIVSSSSVFANNQFAGVWALKSPNTGMVLTNANINGHVLSGNTKYPGAVVGQGELTLGDYNNPTEYQGKAWFAHGNLIDVSAGTNFSLAAWVHRFVSAPSVSYNYITGVDKPSDATQIVDEGAEYASYVGNIGRSASESGDFVYSTLYLKSKVAGRGASYNGNDGFRVDPASTVKPEVMHDVDGHWVYSCVLPANEGVTGLARLKYDGAFTAYTVKLTITSRGGASEAGVIEKYIALKGAETVATTVLANVDVHAYGSPIGVTVNTSNTFNTDIILDAHTGEYAVKLEVIAPTSDRNHILMFY